MFSKRAARQTAVLALVASLLLLLAIQPAAAQATRYVHGGGADSGDCTDPAAPCQTISYALSQAAQFDTVRVAAGTYVENLLLTETVDLLGGHEPSGWTRDPFAYPTVIDGGGLDTAVTFDTGISGTLGGFMITNGSGVNGGGVATDFGSPLLTTLLISDNRASANGGGIYISGNQPRLDNVLLEENEADDLGGGLYIANAQVEIETVALDDNEARDGGGLAVNNGTALISDCSVVKNSAKSGGGGAAVLDGLLEMSQCVVSGNTAADHGSALYAQGANVEWTNVLATGNGINGVPGGVFAMTGSEIFVRNSTLAYNNGDQAVLLWNQSGTLILQNSILWESGLSLQGDPPCPSCFVITYSDVQGYSGSGAGNIDQDPQFVRPQQGNFRLSSGSPAIDSGTAVTGVPPVDIEGTPRDSKPDMGCYEYVAPKLSVGGYLPYVTAP